ncbi:DUF4142 domain-containing protein [Desertibaculum subflavum]|uniref:DUF4142 domain-containing protein n=1 Tax=Desertibaculum subflavum TaxID=2268458 RepID=UPI0013C41DF6
MTLAIACVAGCGPAEGQRAGDAGLPGRRDAPATSPLAANEYLRRAAAIDQFEIQSGRMALQKSDREDIRALGRLLIDDHIRATARLREATDMTAEAAPAPLDSAQQARLRELQTTQTPEFNRLFLDIQRAAHEQALALHRGYASGGDDVALRIAAGEFAALVQKHLEELERIRGTRSAPPPRG